MQSVAKAILVTLTLAGSAPAAVATYSYDVFGLNVMASGNENTLDLLGNRETHSARSGPETEYGPVNAANEYPSVAGQPVTYDAAGNLTADEEGRHYAYDEQNRLTEVRDAGNTVVAAYAYACLRDADNPTKAARRHER